MNRPHENVRQLRNLLVVQRLSLSLVGTQLLEQSQKRRADKRAYTAPETDFPEDTGEPERGRDVGPRLDSHDGSSREGNLQYSLSLVHENLLSGFAWNYGLLNRRQLSLLALSKSEEELSKLLYVP
jgi:hypothetical protein